jgi:hypothetical protein
MIGCSVNDLALVNAQGIALPGSAETGQAPQGQAVIATGVSSARTDAFGKSAASTPPSALTEGFAPRPSRAQLAGVGQPGDGQLSKSAGQEHRIYDLRPYTNALKTDDRPERAVVDWILRETGSEVWFSEPFGFMNVNRDQLSVYHTREMQRLVSGVVERFVEGEKDRQVLNLRVIRVSSPTWRNAAYPLMQQVSAESAGVQAWLLSKENAALLLNQLRQRPDAEQTQDMNLAIHNGQTERVMNIRGRNYVRGYRPSSSGWPPYEPETGEIHEGYKVAISPLLSTDSEVIDCVIEADIDQVDKLNPVDLALPMRGGEAFRGRIDVPQLVSWRLKERFRWPSDMILLLSCGVVAHPESQSASIPLLNLDALTGHSSGRADALLFVQYRGRASENLNSTSGSVPQMAVNPNGSQNPGITRGRY